MFKQIFRLAFVTVIWKQYKGIIVSTLVLFTYLWLVGSVHADYMSYAEIQSDDALVGRSFLYKWAALVTGVIIYIVTNFFRGSRTKTNNKTTSQTKTNAKLIIAGELSDDDDPFAEIRYKEKLRTRAEIVVEKEIFK